MAHNRGEIDRKNRENHHTDAGQRRRHNLAYGGHGEHRGTCGRKAHPSPPNTIAETIDVGIDPRLVGIEYQRRNVGHACCREDVTPQQTQRFAAATEPHHNQPYHPETAYQRYAFEHQIGFATQVQTSQVDNVEVGYGYKQHKQVAYKVATAIGSLVHSDKEVAQQDNTHSQLHRQIGVVPATDLAVQYVTRKSNKECRASNQRQHSEYF